MTGQEFFSDILEFFVEWLNAAHCVANPMLMSMFTIAVVSALCVYTGVLHHVFSVLLCCVKYIFTSFTMTFYDSEF